MLNETAITLVDQAFNELSQTQVAFWIKFFAIIGMIYLLSVIGKTAGSILNLFVYVYAFIKWVIFKIRGKDI